MVRADLAGIDPSEIELQIRGRELVLAGHRKPEGGEERVYQQLEIEHGAFRRVIALGVDVDADAAQASYEDGILTVELPLADAVGRAHGPDPAAQRGRVIEVLGGEGEPAAPDAALPDELPGPAAARHGHLPRHADPARRRPGPLDPARQRRAGRRPDAGDARPARSPRSTRPSPDQLYDVGVAGHRRAHAQGARRLAADPRPGRPAREDRRSGSATEPYLDRARLRAARRGRGGPGADRADAQRPADVQPDHRGGPVPPRGAADGGRQPRGPVGAQPPDRRRAADQGSEEKQALLEEVDVGKRLRRLSEILARELDIVAIGSKIQSQVNVRDGEGRSASASCASS